MADTNDVAPNIVDELERKAGFSKSADDEVSSDIINELEAKSRQSPLKEDLSKLTPEEIRRAAEYGANLPRGASIPRGAFLHADEPLMAAVAAPFEYAAGKLGATPRSLGEAYAHRLAALRALRHAYEEANPVQSTVEEFAGGFATPMVGPLTRYVAGYAQKVPTLAGRIMATGAGVGGPLGAAENTFDAMGENKPLVEYPEAAGTGLLQGTLGGALLAPVVAGGARTAGWLAGHLKSPLSVVTGQIGKVFPESWLQNATEAHSTEVAHNYLRKAIDEMGETINTRAVAKGQPPEAVDDRLRKQFIPEPGQNLAQRPGWNLDTQEALLRRVADQQDKGNPRRESLDDIANDFGIARSTVSSYYDKFKNMHAVPTNLAEATYNAARNAESVGAHAPVRNLLRVTAGSRGEGAEAGEMAANLEQRQLEQADRITQHIDRASGVGQQQRGAPQNYEEALDRAKRLMTTEADREYNAARAAVDANGSPRPISLEPLLAAERRNVNFKMVPETPEREALDKAITLFSWVEHKNWPGQTVSAEQAGTDVARYLAARRAVDGMITRARASGDTPTAGLLSKFRRTVNDEAQRQHPELKAADLIYSEGRTADDILDHATKMATRLNPKAREDIAYFDSLTPEQKEIFRLGYGRTLKDIVENTREGSAALAGKFQTKGVRELTQKIFGVRGAELNNNILKEGATTATLAAASGGSQTTPWREALDQFRLNAQLPAQIMLGHKAGAIHTVAEKLKYLMANRQAAHLGTALTNTDPFENLNTLAKIRANRESAARAAAMQSAMAQRVGVRGATALTDTGRREGADR
jgi:hypothetical protein